MIYQYDMNNNLNHQTTVNHHSIGSVTMDYSNCCTKNGMG